MPCQLCGTRLCQFEFNHTIVGYLQHHCAICPIPVPPPSPHAGTHHCSSSSSLNQHYNNRANVDTVGSSPWPAARQGNLAQKEFQGQARPLGTPGLPHPSPASAKDNATASANAISELKQAQRIGSASSLLEPKNRREGNPGANKASDAWISTMKTTTTTAPPEPSIDFTEYRHRPSRDTFATPGPWRGGYSSERAALWYLGAWMQHAGTADHRNIRPSIAEQQAYKSAHES